MSENRKSGKDNEKAVRTVSKRPLHGSKKVITINMSSLFKDERYSGHIQKDSEDPFALIDTTANPEGLAKDIAENLEKAADYVAKAAEIIEESRESVRIHIDSLSTQRHGRVDVEALASLMALVMAAYEIDSNNECGHSLGSGNLTLAYKTEYSMLHTLYELIVSVLEHAEYKQEWLDQLRSYQLPVAGSNSTEYKFRIAVVVANILNVIGWERMRDATEESGEYLDKYGTINVEG